MKGRKPIPNELHILRGNPGKRPLPVRPRVASEVPPCPRHIDTEAKREWRRVTKELHASGMLAKIDRAALAAYCQSWSRWVEAEENTRKAGLVVKTKNGHPMLNPYLTIANEAMRQMLKYLTEFGMTPSSRSRVSPLEDKPSDSSDPWAGIANG